MARFAMEFCAAESCGKCTPCRIGSVRGVETIDRIIAGDNVSANLTLLDDLCDTMTKGSLCAMGGLDTDASAKRSETLAGRLLTRRPRPDSTGGNIMTSLDCARNRTSGRPSPTSARPRWTPPTTARSRSTGAGDACRSALRSCARPPRPASRFRSCAQPTR